jgi:hypothetical protein
MMNPIDYQMAIYSLLQLLSGRFIARREHEYFCEKEKGEILI